MGSENTRDVTALILAGGRGKRMGMLCTSRPKPLLPFAGQFKVIDFVLSNCINSGIGRIAAAVEYCGAKLESYLHTWQHHVQSQPKMAILFPRQDTYAGTADAIYQNLDHLRRWDSEIILVLAGDHIYNMDYRQLISFHNRSRADVTLATFTVPTEDAHRFGIVNADESGRIVGFEEKPNAPKSTLASMGIYVFNKKTLYRHLEEDAIDPNSRRDFGYNVIPKMIKFDRCFSYQFNDYWQDVGTPESYLTTNLELCCNRPRPHFDQRWNIHTQMTEESEPVIGPKAMVVNSRISPGCVVNGTVINSVLSPGVLVDEYSRVVDSVIMQNARINKNCFVDRCIIDEEEIILTNSKISLNYLDTPNKPSKLPMQSFLSGYSRGFAVRT